MSTSPLVMFEIMASTFPNHRNGERALHRLRPALAFRPKGEIAGLFPLDYFLGESTPRPGLSLVVERQSVGMVAQIELRPAPIEFLFISVEQVTPFLLHRVLGFSSICVGDKLRGTQVGQFHLEHPAVFESGDFRGECLVIDLEISPLVQVSDFHHAAKM